MRITSTAIIACCLLFAATECLARDMTPADSKPIDPQKYPIRGIRGGDTMPAVEKALTGQFQKTQCKYNTCFASTVENASGMALRLEMITVSFAGLGGVDEIEYTASYAKGSNAAECRPHLDALRAEVLSRYGTPANLTGPDTPRLPNAFVAGYLAEGAPTNQNPVVHADEFMDVSGSCDEKGKLLLKMAFGSEAIGLVARKQATSAKPEF